MAEEKRAGSDPHDPGVLTLEDVTSLLFRHRAGTQHPSYFDCADEDCQATAASWPCDVYRLAWHLRIRMERG